MKTKPIILSSSGLKNVVLNKYQEEDDFIFVFGNQNFRMKNIYAEFISPVVSHLHQTDPTINMLNLGKLISSEDDKIEKMLISILTPETITLLLQISNGSSIEITEEQSIKIRYLSLLLGNDELHSKLNELFPPKYSKTNVNLYLKNIECCYNFSSLDPDVDFPSLITFISKNFYQLDYEEFLKIPRDLQYKIISNPNIRIESEDALFDIIIKIIESTTENDQIDDVMFLEQIEFTELNEENFRYFINSFDISEISRPLWNKLCKLFFDHSTKKGNSRISKRLQRSDECEMIVGGFNKFTQLLKEANNKGKNGKPIISPPIKTSIETSTSLLSFSVYGWHSVCVFDDGSIKGIGYNNDGRINGNIKKTKYIELKEFSMNDRDGYKMKPISTVCCGGVTLYLFEKKDGGRELVICDCFIKDGEPIFLNIGEKKPIAIFGGHCNTAAITDEGEIIFINRDILMDSPELQIDAVSLPDGENASIVACCNDSVLVLSSSGRLFYSDIKVESSDLTFSEVLELKNEEIVFISGTREHFFAVSKNGKVFGRGSNEFGRLGLGEGINACVLFTEISALRKYKIKAAYAGCWHSLFETTDGKVLSCGSNNYGELLLSSGPGENVYLPSETTITSGAYFCIAGGYLSVVFIGEEPLPNMPNKRIEQFQI